MARGWESKAIEAQVEEAERRAQAGRRGALTPAERERQERRRGLELTRARLRADLARSTAPAYRQMLERAIEAVERQLSEVADAGRPGPV